MGEAFSKSTKNPLPLGISQEALGSLCAACPAAGKVADWGTLGNLLLASAIPLQLLLSPVGVLLRQACGHQDLDIAQEPVHPAQEFLVGAGGKFDLVVQVLIFRGCHNLLAGMAVAPLTDEGNSAAVKTNCDLGERQLAP